MSMSISISNLPEDISQEILLRLPVKYLLRFKSVSKSFCSLIRSSSFINKHINHSIQNNNVMFISSNYHLKRSQVISLNPLLNFQSNSNGFIVEHKDYEFEFGTSYGQIDCQIDSFCGSSNGLLCIRFIAKFVCDGDYDREEQIVLLNPATKEFKKIYLPRKISDSSFLFAYDCKIDDYKLVRVERFDPSYNNKRNFEVEVYTLGTGSWRKIGNVSYLFVKHQLGVLVNGALHWFVVSVEKMLIVLVSFDIANEKFVELPLPKEHLTPLDDDKYGKNVAELRGRLCLVLHFGVRVDVWVMQEYGVSDSWTKSFTITEETITKAFNLRFKWSFENNKILLQADGKLILYDPKSERYWKLACCQITEAVNYVTSLVSLNSGTYLK